MSPQATGKKARAAAANGPGGARSSAANGKTGNLADGRGSAQRRGPPTGAAATPRDAVQPLATATSAAPGDGSRPKEASVIVWKDAVGPASTRLLGYTDVRVGPRTAASAGLTRLKRGMLADADPKLIVPLGSLDVFVATLVRGVVGSTLPAGEEVGKTGGWLRWHQVRSAQALPPCYEGPVGEAVVTQTPPGVSLSPGCLDVELIGAEAVELEVVRGSHFYLCRGTTRWVAMDGPLELLRVPPSSALVYEACLVRRVPEATYEVDLIWYEALLCGGDQPIHVFATGAPGSVPSAGPGGQKSLQQR